MWKIGDLVEHLEYGKGEVVSFNEALKFVTVSFEKEHDVIIGRVLDEGYYFEDNRRLETTNIIEVPDSSLYYRTHCHTCQSPLSSFTHQKCPKCSWLKCDCDSCKCNYLGIKKRLTQEFKISD